MYLWGPHLLGENVDRVCGEFVGEVERCSCFPFLVPEREEVDAGLEFDLDGGDLVMFHWVFDLVESRLCEEAVVAEWPLRIFRAWVKD